MRLHNKVIIVTGSCTGIGKAIALRCVAEGASVVVHGLEQDLGEVVIEEIEKGKAVLLIEEITNEGAPERLVELALKTFGKLDAVVNNAATIPSSNMETTDLAFLRRTLDVNAVAPFALIKAAFPFLTKEHGCVLNIGSVNAWSGEPNLFAYSVSKGALMTMTRNLGDTLFREGGVRVNQINPGWVLTETEILRKRSQGLSDDWYKDIPSVYAPAGRILWPSEIAAAAVYWLADESGPLIGRNPPKN
jgi:NAD(P)-dependent dehydrogenase (short-subunit alcohol dehydrogenase family)